MALEATDIARIVAALGTAVAEHVKETEAASSVRQSAALQAMREEVQSQMVELSASLTAAFKSDLTEQAKAFTASLEKLSLELQAAGGEIKSLKEQNASLAESFLVIDTSCKTLERLFTESDEHTRLMDGAFSKTCQDLSEEIKAARAYALELRETVPAPVEPAPLRLVTEDGELVPAARALADVLAATVLQPTLAAALHPLHEMASATDLRVRNAETKADGIGAAVIDLMSRKTVLVDDLEKAVKTLTTGIDIVAEEAKQFSEQNHQIAVAKVEICVKDLNEIVKRNAEAAHSNYVTTVNATEALATEWRAAVGATLSDAKAFTLEQSRQIHAKIESSVEGLTAQANTAESRTGTQIAELHSLVMQNAEAAATADVDLGARIELYRTEITAVATDHDMKLRTDLSNVTIQLGTFARDIESLREVDSAMDVQTEAANVAVQSALSELRTNVDFAVDRINVQITESKNELITYVDNSVAPFVMNDIFVQKIQEIRCNDAEFSAAVKAELEHLHTADSDLTVVSAAMREKIEHIEAYVPDKLAALAESQAAALAALQEVVTAGTAQVDKRLLALASASVDADMVAKDIRLELVATTVRIDEVKSNIADLIKTNSSTGTYVEDSIANLRTDSEILLGAVTERITKLVDVLRSDTVSEIGTHRTELAAARQDLETLRTEVTAKTLHEDTVRASLDGIPAHLAALVSTAKAEVVPEIAERVTAALKKSICDEASVSAAEATSAALPDIKISAQLTAERAVAESIQELEPSLLVRLTAKLQAEVDRIPRPRDGEHGKDGVDGKNGTDGKDARVEAPVPFEFGKLHKFGTWVVHRGGVWVAARATDEEPSAESSFWDCIVPGISMLDFGMKEDGRTLTVTSELANGLSTTKALRLPIPIVRGVYSETREFQEKDVVLYDSSWWEAQKDGKLDRPGTTTDWRLHVRRGKDGKAGTAAAPAPWRMRGTWVQDEPYAAGDITEHAGVHWLALVSTRERPPFVRLVSNEVWLKLGS